VQQGLATCTSSVHVSERLYSNDCVASWWSAGELVQWSLTLSYTMVCVECGGGKEYSTYGSGSGWTGAQRLAGDGSTWLRRVERPHLDCWQNQGGGVIGGIRQYCSGVF
jgi:hypothetical protein